MKNNYSIVLIVAIIVGAISFFGGMKYQESKSPVSLGQGPVIKQLGGPEGAGEKSTFVTGGKMGATIGEVISIDDTSITMKLEDGSSKIINLSETTTLSKTDTATAADLKTGEKIAAFGKTNSDGSISAENIQLNPVLQMKRLQDQKEMMEKSN